MLSSLYCEIISQILHINFNRMWKYLLHKSCVATSNCNEERRRENIYHNWRIFQHTKRSDMYFKTRDNGECGRNWSSPSCEVEFQISRWCWWVIVFVCNCIIIGPTVQMHINRFFSSSNETQEWRHNVHIIFIYTSRFLPLFQWRKCLEFWINVPRCIDFCENFDDLFFSKYLFVNKNHYRASIYLFQTRIWCPKLGVLMCLWKHLLTVAALQVYFTVRVYLAECEWHCLVFHYE